LIHRLYSSGLRRLVVGQCPAENPPSDVMIKSPKIMAGSIPKGKRVFAKINPKPSLFASVPLGGVL
jgi:hypothetical protein